MDEIHDMIMQFRTTTIDPKASDDIDHILKILDKMNDKINDIEYAANNAVNIALKSANGIQLYQ